VRGGEGGDAEAARGAPRRLRRRVRRLLQPLHAPRHHGAQARAALARAPHGGEAARELHLDGVGRGVLHLAVVPEGGVSVGRAGAGAEAGVGVGGVGGDSGGGAEGGGAAVQLALEPVIAQLGRAAGSYNRMLRYLNFSTF